jgi:hypothetical protein
MKRRPIGTYFLINIFICSLVLGEEEILVSCHTKDRVYLTTKRRKIRPKATVAEVRVKKEIGMQPDRMKRCIQENVHVVDVFISSFNFFLMKKVGLACVIWMFLMKGFLFSCPWFVSCTQFSRAA